MKKCVHEKKVLVFPTSENDEHYQHKIAMMRSGELKKHLKSGDRPYTDEEIKREKPKKRVFFQPDFKDRYGDDWIKRLGIDPDLDYQRFILPDTGETATLYTVGCGHCAVCRQNHAFQWKLRLLMERECFPRDDDACFLTLDYNELFVPRLDDGRTTLCHDHVAAFLRNVRYLVRKEDPEVKIRFFCAGEYGSETERSHYHLILFGFDFFRNAQYVRMSRGGFPLFRCDIFDRAWSVKDKTTGDFVPRGGALFGMFSEATAMYTAQYCVKKILSDFDSFGRKEPYIQMSRNPGLGHDYIVAHKEEILKDGGVYLHGEFFPISRYMMKVFTADKNFVPGIYQIDFERRRLLKERAERLDTQQQALTDLPLWLSRERADEVALSRSKVHARMKGGL